MGYKILNICVNGIYTDGYTYHENLLPKYHKKIGNDVYILASEYEYGKSKQVNKAKKLEYVDENGIKIKRLKIKGDKDISYKFKRFIDFYESIEDIEPDIIFCHLFQFLDVRKVIEYKEAHPKIRVFFDSHADKINSAHTVASRLVLHKVIWKYYAKKAYAVAEKFYGVSPARVQFLKEMYGLPEEKTKLLVMGTDDEMVDIAGDEERKRQTRERYGILDNDFLIVTGGKIDRSKWQVLNLMRAIEMLPVKLIVFGAISDDIKEEVLNLTSEKVQYAGWMNEQEAYELFAIASLAVFPSTHSVYWEQVTGQGIPIVVKKWIGFEHLDLGNNLKYLYNGSVDEIVKVLSEILKDYNWLKMKECAEKIGCSQFSYKRLAEVSIEFGGKV